LEMNLKMRDLNPHLFSRKVPIVGQLEGIQGDITKQSVDVIVNAAHTGLTGGGGVDGAIHRAAGPELLEECRKLKGCKTGEAKITKAYKLPAKFVIHTPGPVWSGGKRHEDELLEGCYRNSLELASQNGLHTVAFPSISTGVYHFPKDRAADIAIGTVQDYLAAHQEIEKVIFVCFSAEDLTIYNKKLKG